MKLLGIKLYNPFKPHIVVDGFGKYRIRIYSVLGWKYWGGNLFYCSEFYADNDCKNLELALEKLREAEDYLVKEKTRKKLLKIKYKVVNTE